MEAREHPVAELIIPEGHDLKRYGIVDIDLPVKPLVYVCGLHSSGNRTVERCLQRLGFDVWIVHGVPRPDEVPEKDFGRHARRCAERMGLDLDRRNAVYAIMPIRSEWCRLQSVQAKSDFYGWANDYDPIEMTARVFEAARRYGIPVRTLSYEAFVAAPSKELFTVLDELCGRGPAGSESQVVRWIDEHVFDANEKYR